MEQFRALDQQAEELLDQLSKDEVAQCARLLAHRVVDYRLRFGAIEHESALGLLAAMEVDPSSRLVEVAQLLLDQLIAVRDGNPANGLH